jgi:hypothetical protein
MKILDFLFGKSPDIFDEHGNVVHKLGDKKWQDWRNRFIANKEYNWREHRGTERKVEKRPPEVKK